MPDHWRSVSGYKLRRAQVLARTSRRVQWDIDDALRYRHNFLQWTNRKVQGHYGWGYEMFMQEHPLTVSQEFVEVHYSTDNSRVYWFLHDQGLYRYFVQPRDHGHYGVGWQWAWPVADIWKLFLPNSGNFQDWLIDCSNNRQQRVPLPLLTD